MVFIFPLYYLSTVHIFYLCNLSSRRVEVHQRSKEAAAPSFSHHFLVLSFLLLNSTIHTIILLVITILVGCKHWGS